MTTHGPRVEETSLTRVLRAAPLVLLLGVLGYAAATQGESVARVTQRDLARAEAANYAQASTAHHPAQVVNQPIEVAAFEPAF